MKRLFLKISLLIASNTICSQTTCPANKILGEWHYFTTFHPVAKINVDSLKNLLNDVSRFSKDTSQFSYKIEFFENGTRKYTLKKSGRESLGVYKLDTINCKIIYGKRKKPGYKAIVTIEYLDEKCMFSTKWNPHGPWTTFYYRK